ncbi:TPA: DUF6701 domain-containing protein [Vibrio parahaemolyticus]|nr:MSHA biogenesis protein MshQ [Vibrio parahaemolyticus]
MKKINLGLAFILFMFTTASWANSCGYKSNKEAWDFKFSINKAQSDDTIKVHKKQGHSDEVILWAGKESTATNAVFKDNRDLTEQNNQGWIFYEPGNTGSKKSGLATYYRKSGNGWELIERRDVDFSDLHGANIEVSSTGISLFDCYTTDSAHPPINRSPKFEFGTVDCSIGSTCKLHFDKPFNTVPLVFIMPVIDRNLTKLTPKRTTEYPSTIGVKGITTTGADLYQDFAPADSADGGVVFIDKNETPMGKIDYFAIEQGVLELENGSKIVAGTIPIGASKDYIGDGVASHYCEGRPHNCNETERNDGVEVRFSDFGLSGGFTEKPGVLVQAQTTNNKDAGITAHWATALARDAKLNRVVIALEKSEVYKTDNNKHLDTSYNPVSKPETVAFVAGQGSGYINGRKFWLGEGQTKYTLDVKDNVIDPVLEGCSVYTPFSETINFDEPPVLVANKNSRRGPDGGWLRRCDITKNSAAFIIEEDMNRDKERGHKWENVGWFMFEKANTNPMCNGFNSPVQTWKRPDGYVPVDARDGQLHLYGSPAIVGAPLVDGERVLGFLQGHIHDNVLACSGQTCKSDNGLMTGQEALENFPNYLGTSKTVQAGDTLILDDNQTYESLSVGGTVIIKSGRYKIGKIDVWTNGKVIVKSGSSVTIDTRSLAVNNQGYFGIEITSWANPQLPVLADAEFRVNVYNITKADDRSYVDLNTDAQFVGLLYSEKHVEMSGNATVYGSVSARSVQMTGSSKIQAATECIAPPTSYELTVTPTKQYALTCGEDQPSFIIETKNGTQPESTGVTVRVEPNDSGLAVQVADNVGAGRYPHFSSSNLGKLKLSVMVTNNDKIELNKDYKLTITLDSDSSKTHTSTFKFVPFKFDVGDQTIVAGQNYLIETRVLACSDGQQTVVKSYTGAPSIQLELKAPNGGRSDQYLLTYAPEFTRSEQGTSSDEIFNLMESGLYTIKLEDENFTCDPNYSDNCPIAVDDDTQASTVVLNGSFSVKSRPWKIAACDIAAISDGKANPATQDSGDGFIPAGERFNVTYKPIVHSDSRGSAKNVCDYPLTQNYFSDGAMTAPLGVEFSVSYPTGGDIANLAASNDSELEFSKDEAKAGKSVEYVWNEVGSLNLTTSANYLGEELENGSAIVGRFYPKFFKVFTTQWDYPAGQTFVYMNQPFKQVNYKVEALNANEDEVSNYAAFSKHAQFNIAQLIDYPNRFVSRTANDGTWSVFEGKSIGSFTIDDTNTTSCRNSSNEVVNTCWLKGSGAEYPDGPFNITSERTSNIGLVYTNNADPVEYIINDEKGINSRLVAQPDIRFGRIALDDVGGNQGTTLHIPLRVEYWNDGRFIVNQDDSQTKVMGVTEEDSLSHIWPKDNSAKDVTLGEGGTVTSGSSRSVTATQAEPYRQQSQIRLDLDSTGNSLPWLMYDWNKDGSEENPPSIVTFGIHRGNDRVIYRGEPGLTGQ